MKALVCRAYGPLSDLRIEEVPDPEVSAGNVVVGVRAAIDVRGTQIVVRGNYVHVTGVLAGWNQLAALYATGEDGAMVVEHNVVRGGNWLVRSFSGGSHPGRFTPM